MYNIAGWEVMKSAFTNEQLPDPLDVKTEEAIDASVDMVSHKIIFGSICVVQSTLIRWFTRESPVY